MTVAYLLETRKYGINKKLDNNSNRKWFEMTFDPVLAFERDRAKIKSKLD